MIMNREFLIGLIVFVFIWVMFSCLTHATPFEATFGTIVTLKLGSIKELLEDEKENYERKN